MTFLDALVVVLALLAILWTLLPLFRSSAWWIRGFEFPRVQVTVLLVLALITYAGGIGWSRPLDITFVSALGLCIVFQLTQILPYTSLYPVQLKTAEAVPKDSTLDLVVANVLTPNRNADTLLKHIRSVDPDVVLAVETDSWWQSQLDQLGDDYPYAVKRPLDNLYGMHLYSKLKLIDPEILFLVEDDVPSIHTDVVLRSGQRVALHCLHPAPPSPTENETSAERDAELLVVAKTIDAAAKPVIVMGDLNDVAWSATTRLFQRLSKLLDPRIGRGMFNTFHAKYPYMRWPLDHVFCSKHFRLVSMERLPYFGSDHFPMHAVLCFAPEGAAEQEDLRATVDDEDQAEEKINEVDANEAKIKARSLHLYSETELLLSKDGVI